MGKIMKLKIEDERGFTFIEVIVTLILVGITAAMAGMWIVSVASGYVFAKKNMETTQKAQLTLTRLEKEFKSISTINLANTNSTKITYSRLNNSGVTITDQTVALSGSLLKLNNDTLTNNVSAFTLSYCNDDLTDSVCSESWNPLTSRIIVITLKLTGADNVQSTFTQRVAPRNL